MVNRAHYHLINFKLQVVFFGHGWPYTRWAGIAQRGCLARDVLSAKQYAIFPWISSV